MQFVARLTICLLAVFLLGCSRPAPTLTVTDYGIYDARLELKGDWKQGIPVEVVSVNDAKLKETTTRIPAQTGINWGVSTVVTNHYLLQAVKVVGVMEHPAFTSPDGKTTTEDVFPLGTVDANETLEMPYFWCFLEQEPYELVPGKWTLRIEVDGQTLMTKAFEIYKP